ncbi:MAG: helix-turn-helix domain-containing protein [Patescibacteria group bacterium]|jgi:excisionase family DNA binding protein
MEKILTIKEVAELLRISPKSVYRLIASGRLKAVKVGHNWRVLDFWENFSAEKSKIFFKL